MRITYRPIGVVHSPFTDLADMPIQPSGDAAGPATVEVFPAFAEGLADLDGFSHVVLLCHLHAVRRCDLRVVPFLGGPPRGVFATRAPTRPNPIAMSVVRLLRVDGNRLEIDHVDMLDGTPVLDIKPYVPDFDAPEEIRLGWLEEARRAVRTTRSDDRFR